MGLDMYFSAKFNINSYDNQKAIDSVVDVFPFVGKDTVDGVCVDITLGYWRKANAIHNWFVKNVQDGIDECQKAFVERHHVVELLELVNKVLDNRELAPTLLPPTSGFFFGSTDLDEWYWGDIEHTKKVLENALSVLDNSGNYHVSLYYQSSW